MTGLGGGVNDVGGFQGGQAFQHGLAIPDVEFVMAERGVQAFEPLLIPARVSLRPEEVGTHVVVNAMHLPAKLAEIIDDFGTDEAGRTGGEESHEKDVRDSAWENINRRQNP